jgi:hypothetical protein
MTSPGPLAERISARWLAFVQAYRLDAELANGFRPSASPAHQLRADRLHRARVRRRIAYALSRAVADARRPVRNRTAQAPLSRMAIRCCDEQLLALATSVATLENPRTQGLAIASQLAFDGGGPLFFQFEKRGDLECLANTIQAADAALRVSAYFDEPVSAFGAADRVAAFLP